jgi:hypothetical protein
VNTRTAIESLREKTQDANRLAEALKVSQELNEAMPTVFEHGRINVKLYSTGSHGRPMIRVTRGDGSVQETPLVDMPLEVIRQFESQIKRMRVGHNDWRKALRLIT